VLLRLSSRVVLGTITLTAATATATATMGTNHTVG